MIKKFKVEASKKSVKASAQDENFDKSFKLKGTTYYIELLSDGGNYIAKWWDSSDNGLGYNNKGWVTIEGKNYRRLNDIEEVTADNIMDLLGIISDYDRKPGKPVQDRIKREVAKLVDFDEINAACNKKKSVKSSTRCFTKRPIKASKANSSKSFKVKASTAAKKRRAIKASGITDDIVIYFNGDNIYQGSIYDMTESIENLCYDDEVNTKFQEWCNQFGDPFDFDGSPIDTAAVFTDLIIHEADEAPVSEDGKSEFYVDGNGILDFEIFYADDIYGASKKSVKCAEDDEDEFIVKWFYDDKFRDLAGDEEFTDLSDAESCAHEHLDEFCVTISHPEAGTVYINPDKYWDNFDGEFACLPEIAEWQNDVWKSMGIGAATTIGAGRSLNMDAKPNHSDWILRGYRFNGEDVTTNRIDFQDDVKKAVLEMFEDPDIETIDLYKIATDQDTTGVFEDEEFFETITRDDINASTDIKAAIYSETDTQVLGELDDYIQNNYPIYVSVDTVDYRDENDWAVDIFADGLMVDSDFQFFLNEHNSYLYNRLSEAGLLSNTRANNIVMGEDFSFQFYENQNQWRAPTITIDKSLLKEYDADGSVYSELANQIDDFNAQYINTLQEINYHLGSFLAEYDAKVTASTDITAAIGTESDVADDEYNNALADETISILHKDGYEDVTVSAEQDAISFFWNNEVVYVQPTNEITPNLADIYDDSKELSDAVRAALDEEMMDKYDADNQALAFSEDVDDLDYITGEEDYGFGFDSNGDPVDESTVEELERIAQDMVYKSGIAAVDQYADLHNFNYYASMPYVQESFDISFQLIADYYTLNNYGFIPSDSTMWSTTSEYTIPFNVRVENGEVKYVETPDPYERKSWGTVDEDLLRKLDTDAMTEWAKNLVAPVAKEIYITTSNI